MNDFSRDDGIGLGLSGVFHLLLLLIALWMHKEPPVDLREALIEVTLGEFRMGAAAQFSPQTNPEVATRTNPQDVTSMPQNVPKDVIDLPTRERIPDAPVLPDPTPKPPVDPPAQRDVTDRDGADAGGSVRGVRGSATADQGSGNDPVRSAPYLLAWEGDIQRSPLVQPMPEYKVEVEANITMRFEVRPDGTVGQIQPLQRMNPELEREVMTTLRTWRFSRLPGNVPQESQWGRITFRFRMR